MHDLDIKCIKISFFFEELWGSVAETKLMSCFIFEDQEGAYFVLFGVTPMYDH